MNTRKDMNLSPHLIVAGVALGIALGGATILAVERLTPAAPEAADRQVLIAARPARPTIEAVVAAAAGRAAAAEPASGGAISAQAPAASPVDATAGWTTAGRPQPGAAPAVAIAARAPQPAPAPAPPETEARQAPVPATSLELAMMSQRRELDPAAAATALAIAAGRAKRCLEPGDPRGTMPVRVTFAPSGQVTSATVMGGPFAGTEVGSCVAVALRSARVGAFEGPAVTVRRTVTIR